MYLYKYYPPSLTRVLRDLTLRFTQPQYFNDPFEVFPNVEAIIPREQLDDYLAQFNPDAEVAWNEALADELALRGLPAQLAEFLKYDVARNLGFDVVAVMGQLVPFTVEKNRERFAADLQRTLGERIGILSLAENPTSLLMWAHYAASHEGFVLVFDSSHSFFNQATREVDEIFGSLFPVTYSTDRPAITLYDPTVKDMKVWGTRLMAQVFLSKGMDWSYEREWRMFLPLNDSSYPHITDAERHLFAFPPDALLGVILGARAAESTRVEIEGTVKSNSALRHVFVANAQISVRRFEVMIGLNQ